MAVTRLMQNTIAHNGQRLEYPKGKMFHFGLRFYLNEK